MNVPTKDFPDETKMQIRKKEKRIMKSTSSPYESF